MPSERMPEIQVESTGELTCFAEHIVGRAAPRVLQAEDRPGAHGFQAADVSSPPGL